MTAKESPCIPEPDTIIANTEFPRDYIPFPETVTYPAGQIRMVSPLHIDGHAIFDENTHVVLEDVT